MEQPMKCQIDRFHTFLGVWNNEDLDPHDLSAIGFFYLPRENAVQCAFCQVVIPVQFLLDQPLKQHFEYDSSCPFLKGNQVGNVPMTNMSNESDRLKTFKYWPSSLNPGELAKAGFYYTYKEDCVRCFSCKIDVEHWMYYDIPLRVHEKLTRVHHIECSFLKTIPCEESSIFLCQTCMKKGHGTVLCKICMDRELNTVFLPCNHLVSCDICASQVNRCSICRTVITNKLKIFMN